MRLTSGLYSIIRSALRGSEDEEEVAMVAAVADEDIVVLMRLGLNGEKKMMMGAEVLFFRNGRQ